ncbi:MAG: Gfo/Idh/MocA family oxidoreductase [Acidobacteriota bacterium]
MSALKVGVIGTGHLGRHHVRILSEMPESELVGLYDQKPELAAELARAHHTRSFASPDELLDSVDALVLAVPTFAHAKLGIEALEKGLHLMVEKPMASTVEEADAMLRAARREGQVIAVGHVEFYNPAVQALLGLDDRARFIEAQRLSPFTPRSLDVDVLLDLMIHDLQLLHALDPSPVSEVRCTGIDVLSSRIDIATARIEFESGASANVTASRVSAEPVRKMRVFHRHRYFSIDYREQEIKGYALEVGDEQGEKRRIVPVEFDVAKVEPLRAELEAFVGVCRGEKRPYVSGEDGRRALETALRVRDAIGG